MAKATKKTTKTTRRTASKRTNVTTDNTPVVGIEATATNAPTSVTGAEDLSNLLTKVEQLQRALMDLSTENLALKTAIKSSGGGDRVVLENTGYVQITVPIDGEPTLVLDSYGSRRTGSVPRHVYERLQRDTDLFRSGYLRVVGSTSDNPNIIESPDAWIAERTEGQIREDVRKINSIGTLNKLWSYVDSKQDPTGKDLVARTAISARFEELTGAEII